MSKPQISNQYNAISSGNFISKNTKKYPLKQAIRAGDWICFYCHNFNYSFRRECNRCQNQTISENVMQNYMMLWSYFEQQNFNKLDQRGFKSAILYPEIQKDNKNFDDSVSPNQHLNTTDCSDKEDEEKDEVTDFAANEQIQSIYRILDQNEDIGAPPGMAERLGKLNERMPQNTEYSFFQKQTKSLIPEIIQIKKEQTQNQQYQRKEDWVCILCKNLNYSFRVHCNRCSAHRDSQN